MSIPVICLAEESVSAFRTYHPENWSSGSRDIVHSCAVTAGVIRHNVAMIGELCGARMEICRPRFNSISASDALNRVRVFVQEPRLHSAIMCFFVSTKTLLDFIVRLICEERVVGSSLDGFHKKGTPLLNALERNVSTGREHVAEALTSLVRSHKKAWIDYLIGARDSLSHPRKGTQQLMFEVEVAVNTGFPKLEGVLVPRAGTQPIDRYAGDIEHRVHEFALSVFDCLVQSKLC